MEFDVYVQWRSREILSLLVNTQQANVLAQLHAVDDEYLLYIEWNTNQVILRLWNFKNESVANSLDDEEKEYLINVTYGVDYEFNGGHFVYMVTEELNSIGVNVLSLNPTFEELERFLPKDYKGWKRLY